MQDGGVGGEGRVPGCMSLNLKGGRVHVTGCDRRQGAFEAGCMSLDTTGGRMHVTGYERMQGACHWISKGQVQATG